MPEQPAGVTRRHFVSAGATLLAGFGLAVALPRPDRADAAPAPDGGQHDDTTDLALFRPVSVSSTDYAPTPGEFAVDGLAEVGVRGSGWRAAQGDPQWIAVDLQAACRVESVVLTFEAVLSDPTFVGSGGVDPRDNTSGFEVLSACAVAFTLDVSPDAKTWTTVYETSSGPGGVVPITLAEPVTARWVRMTGTKRSNGNPLGLNGFSVYGRSDRSRPQVTGWTNWPVHHGAPPPLSVGPDGVVPVESGWVLTMDDWAGSGDGAVLSGPSVDTSRWLPATVPGTVLASLVEQGQLPDPVYGWNNLHVPEALSRHDWWYRRSFELPRGLSTGRGRRVWLDLDGVNHQADVWLNGTSIGQLTHPFGRAAFDITHALRPGGRQHLAVRISPMPYPGSPGDKGPSGISYTDAGIGEMNLSSPTYLAVSGWDWMPAVRDRASGIWNHVRLRATGDAVLGDPRIDTTTQTVDFPQQTARYLRIQGGKRATGWGISMWTLSVIDSSNPDVDLALHSTATASSIDNPNDIAAYAVDGDPKTRWSSNYTDNQWIQLDLGAPRTFDRVVIVWEAAYAATFSIQVSNDGSTWTDARDVDNQVTPLKIIVNGTPVFCRGGSWGWDELLRRMLPDRMEHVMAMHRGMHFTMIRNWIGSSDREELFAAADKYGLLVWNEFPDAFSLDPANHDTYLAQARDTVLRYRSHPSIVVWFGCNEGTPPPVIDSALREAVTTLSGLLYEPDSNAGVITGDGPYWWIDPSQYFTGAASWGNIGFHSEIGIPTVSVADSMRNLVGPDDPGWPIGGPWYLHDWCSQGGQAVQGYLDAIQRRLGDATSLDDFCRKAQFVNYESIRAIFEAWNARLWNNATGVLLWMSNPAWHSTVWQTYDYDLDVNGSYYGARKGCEPLHIQANLVDWSVIAVNHSTASVTGLTATADLYDLAGKPLASTLRKQLDIAASNTAPAFTVPFDASLPACHLLRLLLRDRHGAVIAENTYWRYRTDTDLQALNTAGHTTLTVRRGPVRTDTDGRRRTIATVRNAGRTVAAMVRVGLRDRHTGERILPTRYSDKYFWLLPGETRDITVAWRDRRHASRLPQILVEAYNAPPARD